MKMFKITVLFLALLTQVQAAKIKYDLGIAGKSEGLISRSKDNHTIYFNLPDKKWIKSARLNLSLKYSSMLQPGSYLKIFVNDTPLATKEINSGKNQFAFNQVNHSVLIPRDVYRGGSLKISVESNSQLLGDPCLVAGNANGLIHITSETGVTLDYRRVPHTISDYLKYLPKTANILLAKEATSYQLFDLIYSLKKIGRKYQIVTDAKSAHIVVGQQEEIFERLKETLEREEIREFKNLNSALEVRSFEKRTFLLINTTKLEEGSRLYTIIGKHSSIFEQRLANPSALDLNPKSFARIYRDDLSISEHGVKTKLGHDWTFTINPTQIAGDNLPNKLYLSLTSSASSTSSPNQLHIFQNQQLLRVVDLENTGRPQSFTFNLNPYMKNQRQDFKASVVFSDKSGSCSTEGANQIAAMLPDTHLSFTAPGKKTMGLAQSSLFLNGKVDFFYPVNSNLVNTISHLVTVANSYGLSADQIVFKEYDPSQTINFERSFIIVTKDKSIDGMTLPLQSNKVSTLISEIKNEEVKAKLLGKIAISQVATSGEFNGVNIHFPGNIYRSAIDYISFDKSDVIFTNHNKVLSTFDSKAPHQDLTAFSKENVFDTIYSKYKYLFFFLTWLVLTFVFIRLSRKN